LLGVLIGGLLNWYIQREVERQRQRAHARAGVRLLDIELRSAKSNLEVAESGYWPRDLTLPTETWAAYREILAIALERSEWDTLARAIAALDHLKIRLAEEGGGTGPPDVTLSPGLSKEIVEVRERIDFALELCGRLQQK
jgi:hypothetical protein